MALKILSRGFLKPGDKKKKFDLITIRICGRPCSISFFPPESMAKFKRIQNDDPQIISGALLDIDCSNINIPSVRPKEPIYHSPHIPDGPNYAHYISSRSSREAYDRAMDRHRDRVTALEMGADDKYDRDMAKFKEALAKFEARVRNAEEKIEANKKEITDKFNEFTFYIYKNDLYYFNSPEVHSQNDQKLLIKKYYVGEQKKLDKFQKELEIIERLALEPDVSREPIPETVRMFVWRRDQGKCVRCGSKENLEFDHIIPISKGGSNTERNIQILCEHCNREKSDKI